jgi:catechol-2,3-dioxygenase
MTRIYNNEALSLGMMNPSNEERSRAIMLKSITANLMVESVEETMVFYKEVLGFSELTSVPNESGKL